MSNAEQVLGKLVTGCQLLQNQISSQAVYIVVNLNSQDTANGAQATSTNSLPGKILMARIKVYSCPGVPGSTSQHLANRIWSLSTLSEQEPALHIIARG